jgi:hypothetical protein
VLHLLDHDLKHPVLAATQATTAPTGRATLLK